VPHDLLVARYEAGHSNFAMRLMACENSAVAVEAGSNRYALDFPASRTGALATRASQKDHPMRFNNRVTQALGVDIPILQAPMGWIARSQLASAVSRSRR